MLVRGNCSICFDVTARATLQVGHRPFWYQALVCFQRRPDKGLISSWTVPFSPIHHRTARQGVEEVQQGAQTQLPVGFQGGPGLLGKRPSKGHQRRWICWELSQSNYRWVPASPWHKTHGSYPAWLGWDSTLLWSRNGRHHYPPTRLNGGVSKATGIASVSKPSHTAHSDKFSGHRPESSTWPARSPAQLLDRLAPLR